MADDQRRRDLENFIRKLKYKDSDWTGGMIEPALPLGRQAMEARNIAEEALAHQVLKNTGVPIPSNTASVSKKEDFLNRILNERYPEFEGNPNLSFMDKPDKSLHGYYDSNFGSIKLNPETNKDITKALATSLHEAGHKYDHQQLGYDVPKELMKKHSSQLDIPGMYDAAKKVDLDPTEMYEIAAKGHHARIPNLRDADSFGLGALKSYLKNGNFKSVAGPVAGLGMAAAMMPDDASASDFIPGLDQATPAGSSMDDRMIQTEVKARQNYDASNARKDALKALAGKK